MILLGEGISVVSISLSACSVDRLLCKKTTTGSADGIKSISYGREKNPPLFKIEVGLSTTTKKTKEESRMKLDTNSQHIRNGIANII